MKKIVLVLFLILFAGCVQNKCSIDEDCVPVMPLMGAKYLCENGVCVQKPFGNPASEKCVQDGGESKLINPLGEERSVCIFNDGSVCEEWAYFRNECKKGGCIKRCDNLGTRSEGWYDCEGKLIYYDNCAKEEIK